MKNEILDELWKVKDELSEEYGNNIETLAKALLEKEKKDSSRTIDLSDKKKAAA
jgi:ATP-dependent Zn protease